VIEASAVPRRHGQHVIHTGGALVAVDARAARLGLSRVEYIRRRLAQDTTANVTVTVASLRSFSDAFADLADPSVTRGAWE
jgi:hypothetical protein